MMVISMINDGGSKIEDFFLQERKIEINKMKTLLSQVSSKDIDEQTKRKQNKINQESFFQVISKPLATSAVNKQADED